MRVYRVRQFFVKSLKHLLFARPGAGNVIERRLQKVRLAPDDFVNLRNSIANLWGYTGRKVLCLLEGKIVGLRPDANIEWRVQRINQRFGSKRSPEYKPQSVRKLVGRGLGSEVCNLSDLTIERVSRSRITYRCGFIDKHDHWLEPGWPEIR